uniref:Uncharacterized protein n=1 Tax=Oryza rufipogon TaxID=4529 RepID=A0A0E0QWW0_ORYRU
MAIDGQVAKKADPKAKEAYALVAKQRKSKPKSTSAATVATENIDPTAICHVKSWLAYQALWPLCHYNKLLHLLPRGRGRGSGRRMRRRTKTRKSVQPTTPPAKRRKNNEVPQDSPAMRTRSKKSSPAMGKQEAMGTRSKRGLEARVVTCIV